MATTTKQKSGAKKTKSAGTPATRPTSAATDAPVRTDVSHAEGAEGPSPGSVATRGAVPPRDEDLHDAIARRAYEIYEANGRPAGREAEHWAQAEREVRAERSRG